MKTAFDKIMAGVADAVALAKGEADPSTYRVRIPSHYDVRALRKRLHMTQAAFSAKFGFSLSRVRDWEQGRSSPDPAVRAFLIVIEREPEAVSRALETAA